jgi:hypothetical protein
MILIARHLAARVVAAVGPAILVVGCAPLPVPSPSPASAVAVSPDTCPEAALSTLPPGFVADPPVLTGPNAPYGVRRTFRDPAGRELLSSPGSTPGEPAAPTQVNG